jgi:hypothetical protein
MQPSKMGLTRRLVVASPFAVAFVLNLLSLATYRLHWNPEHVARYGFLFAIPWAWILDGLFVSIHSRWLSALYGYAVLLWVPALLYSTCLWLLLGGIQVFAIRLSRAAKSR